MAGDRINILAFLLIIIRPVGNIITNCADRWRSTSNVSNVSEGAKRDFHNGISCDDGTLK